jgi:hypothetical protein
MKIIDWLEMGDFRRREIIPGIQLKMPFGHEIIQTKVFLFIEKKRLLKENKQRPADPKAILRSNDHKIDIA